MGINWWESDPSLQSGGDQAKQLEAENRDLRERLEQLEQRVGIGQEGPAGER